MSGRWVGGLTAAALLSVLVAGPATGSSNDPHFAKQWALQKIGAQEAWATADGTGTLIAVVDTGVDLGHPDLSSKIVDLPDSDFVDPQGTCAKAAGKDGAKTCAQDGSQDRNGHGTHVAGIAAALTGNGVGVAGTAPGAQILPVRVLDDEGEGTTRRVAGGIRYAAEKGADVINLSLSFLTGEGEANELVGLMKPIHEAIAFATSQGAVVVVSAGNDSAPVCAQPASARSVLCVGATDSRDLRAWYSNGDATTMKNYLVAPGGAGLTCDGEILSTYLRGAETYCSGDDGYDGGSGTSMAAPFVSGVASMLVEKGLTNTEVISCILRSTEDLGTPGRDAVFGYGRLDAAEAVTC